MDKLTVHYIALRLFMKLVWFDFVKLPEIIATILPLWQCDKKYAADCKLLPLNLSTDTYGYSKRCPSNELIETGSQLASSVSNFSIQKPNSILHWFLNFFNVTK